MWSLGGAFGQGSSSSRTAKKQSPVEMIMGNISNWRLLPQSQLAPVLRELRTSTETDDVEGQCSRTAAFAIVPKLAEILLHYSTRNGGEDSIAILTETLACIRFVTKGEGTNISMATNCGVLTTCRDIMNNFPDSAEIQRYCCMVFRSLTFNRADNQLQVVQTGVVPLILAAMERFKTDPSVQSAALMSIQNITWLVEENRNTVEREGGIQHIMTAMQLHAENVEVQKWACGALQNLACCVHCTVLLIDSGALEVVLAAMRNHRMDGTVQNYGLGVLRNISYLKDNRVRVAGSGSIPLALAAMHNHIHESEVQNSACSFFFNTVIDVDDNCHRVLATPGALSVLFASKAAHAKETRFVDKANALLEQLARRCQVVYIDINKPQGPLRLTEACMRVAARLPSGKVGFLPENIEEDMAKARPCDRCRNMFVCSSMSVAAKAKDNNWSYYHLCGRTCADQVVKQAVATHSAEAGVDAVPQGAGH